LETCITVVLEVMVETSRRNVSLPLRQSMPLPNGSGMLGLMYGYLGSPESAGVKVVSLFPNNLSRGLSSHMGLMLLHEPISGRPVALMDAGTITAIRTAAASAVTTEELSRPQGLTLALIGTAETASAHLLAIQCVRILERTFVWGRQPDEARRLAQRHQ
jgi:ornithine cyclodeaminase